MADMEYISFDPWNLMSSVVSVVLGVVAIFLSLYFFVQSRNVQENVRTALAEIKAQTGVLQKITSRQLDRLTKFVTERPDQRQQQLDRLLAGAEQASSILREDLKRQKNINKELVSETINCYITLYFYMALMNYWSQGHLPPPDQFDEQNRSHTQARSVVDASAETFFLVEETLVSEATPEQLQASPVAVLLNKAQQTWQPFVRTSKQIFEG